MKKLNGCSRALDGIAPLDVLEARRDLLLRLLQDQQLLVAVFPRFLALTLAFRSGTGGASTLRTLDFATSVADGLACLEQSPGPFHLLVSEHLADGPGLNLIRAAKAHSPLHRCLLVLTHNHRVLVEAALESVADALCRKRAWAAPGPRCVRWNRCRRAAPSWIRA